MTNEPWTITHRLHTGEVREGFGATLGEALDALDKPPPLQRLRAAPREDARGLLPISFMECVGRATIRRITDGEWDAFQGAADDGSGGPLVIEWNENDFDWLMKDLGLDWPQAQTLTIVDAEGISINGWDDTGYAYDVHIPLAVARAGRA